MIKNGYDSSSIIHDLEHGGNIHKAMRNQAVTGRTLIDFSANINPLGPPAWLRSLMNHDLSMTAHYPDPEYRDMVDSISTAYGVPDNCIVPANGSSELLHLLPRILQVNKIVIPIPCYIEYLSVFKTNGFTVQLVELKKEDGFGVSNEQLRRTISGGEAVIFGNPVNPSGSFVADEVILDLAGNYPDTLFIIDEAFHDFVCFATTVGGRLDNIITLNSLTKFFAIPGLRAGFGIFPERYAKKIKALLPPWSVNTLAQSVAQKGLQDREYCRKSLESCHHLRDELKSGLQKIPGIRCFNSAANYLLCRVRGETSAESLYEKLLGEGILIRRCSNFPGLDHSYFRLAVRTTEENNQLLEKMRRVLSGNSVPAVKRRQAKPLMFQGTSSNAGKSIMAAAFCRILAQDGFRVAPFKAQNMSLNSHVTVDGNEMGRAQVVQAVAARVEPDCRMNPVLLKPNSDTGSQVIINGKPVGNMDVRQYHAYKEQAWKAVTQSYKALQADYDVIVLEGAGSPGEINLKKHDIVNMRMARYAAAPVLVVGDIDRGGVYASFAGTMDVLEEWERNLVAGFVVNKFRGDASLLHDAHLFIKNHTGKEVFSVIPYITDMAIPQEDSVSLRDGFYGDRYTSAEQVEIVVIDLPHISNFTDIDPLHHEPDVNVRFVKSPSSLGNPDAIVIPGSKNVAGDLADIKGRGFESALRSYADQGGTIVGICGGYQMLGRKLRDPHGLETKCENVAGFGLIDVSTVLESEKTLVKRQGTHIDSGCKVAGYEIHHGVTAGERAPVLAFSETETCGSKNPDGTIWGVYLHGIFDADGFRRWFIDGLRMKKNLKPVGRIIAPYNIDKSIDDLAELVRSCFSMDQVYRLIGLQDR